MFQDAMKIGAAIIQMVSMYKKKNSLSKSRSFDLWKIHTLIARKITDQSRASSNCIQIIHQTKPVVLYQEPSQESLDMSILNQNNLQELKIRKAILSIFRFKARSISRSFFNWKYTVLLQKELEKPYHNQTMVSIEAPTNEVISIINGSYEENISDDQENMQSSTSFKARPINEMTAKLGNQQYTQNDIDEVAQGLKPSATNFSKELSQETVSLYQQILECSEKNFRSLIGNTDSVIEQDFQ